MSVKKAPDHYLYSIDYQAVKAPHICSFPSYTHVFNGSDSLDFTLGIILCLCFYLYLALLFYYSKTGTWLPAIRDLGIHGGYYYYGASLRISNYNEID